MIPIPEDLAQKSKSNFSQDSTVNIIFENGRFVVAGPDDPYYTIEELLEGMTEDNLHEEIRTGPSRGSIDDKNIAAPARRSKYRIEDLMAGVTQENLPDKIDFGPPVGRELL